MGAVLTSVAAAITAVFGFLYPPAGGVSARLLAFTIPAGLVLMTLAFRRASGTWPTFVWVAFPVLGVGGVAMLDLLTKDASAAGQVFLCYPVIYAASQLRPLGASVAGGAAIVADAVVVFNLQPLQVALTDFCYVTTTLITMTVLLVRAGEAQERLIGRLRVQAAIDPLTGLVTRRVLDDAAQSAISGAAQETGTALILVDIDRFKTINDTHGHPVGDAVLVHVAALLVANSRPDSVICRMGGDELAILLPGCASGVAVRRAGQLLAAIKGGPLELSDGTLIAISASVGLAHIPSHATGLDDLYKAADSALYDAKHRGRGLVVVAAVRDEPFAAS
jgi:diguanylate cyclase (GGDEF)-like protein